MTRARLADIEADMNAQSRDILGHAIYYTPLGGSKRMIYVQANYEDGEVSGGFGAAIEQRIEMLVLKADIPMKPKATDRIVTPGAPGKTFQPINVQNDETGFHWLFHLKTVPA
jgi:hypothetical protein